MAQQEDILYGRISIAGKVAGLSIYPGPYEVTPTQAPQVLYTQQQTLNTNILVNPIPSNYGLITWNGFFLTVS